MTPATIDPRHCPIPPDGFGSPKWIEDAKPLADAFAERGHSDAEQRASDFLRHRADSMDLRALGFCRQCGAAIQLRQVGRCVYSVPCDHYRAQGTLAKMLPFVEKRRKAITEERRVALLALIGR